MRWALRALAVACWPVLASGLSRTAAAQTAALPELTEPVNDFAHVIDPDERRAIERMSRALKAASGDVVVVATVPTIAGYGDIREYANKLFENHGRGIGDKGKDNGLLILLALKERRVWVEVGYALEQWITDGFAGETSRLVMAPEFRDGRLRRRACAPAPRASSGASPQGRNVTLQGVAVPRDADQRPASSDPAVGHHPRVHCDPGHQPDGRRTGRRRPALGRRRLERLVERRRSVRRRLGRWVRWRRGRRRRIWRRLRRIRRRQRAAAAAEAVELVNLRCELRLAM